MSVIFDDWQLGGGVLPIYRRSAGRRSAPLRIPVQHNVPGRASGFMPSGGDQSAILIRSASIGALTASNRFRFDDWNIVCVAAFVQCNIFMDAMRHAHVPLDRGLCGI